MAVREPPAFGRLLRHYRRTAGLSQEVLAERAGLSVDAVAALERGRRTAPRLSTLTLLATALGLADDERAALLGSVAGPLDRTDGAEPQSPNLNLLPAPAGPLLGREEDLARGCALLRPPAPAVRLLTLVGPGGVGKTALALAIGAALAESYADGVCLVELAAVRDAELVPGAIARALGLRETGERPAAELVRAFLSGRRLLLLLDNVEQVREAGPFLAVLLASAPALTILATSRVALRVRAEHRFPVAPLAADGPSIASASATTAATGAGLTGPERADDALGPMTEPPPAVQLFALRARAVAPDFTLDSGNLAAVAAICRRLDGLPLAIELAAARSALLSPQELLARLGRPLSLLVDGAPDVPGRQRALQATIAWSDRMLTDAERSLFYRLGVFAGGWTVEAAEAICGGTGELDVLSGLSTLVDHSLVQRVTAGGEVRLRMLETIRAYATARLDQQAERDDVRRRHAAYFLGLAERAAAERQGPEQARWLDRLDADHD